MTSAGALTELSVTTAATGSPSISKIIPSAGTLKSIGAANRNRARAVNIVAVLMILFGIAEAFAGIRHNFFGIHTANVSMSAYLGATIGVLYAIAGALILTMKKRVVALALVLLILVIIGRVAMVVTGFYPIDSRPQLVAIALGTTIAVAFAIFIN
jgi:hypothetical protein